ALEKSSPLHWHSRQPRQAGFASGAGETISDGEHSHALERARGEDRGILSRGKSLALEALRRGDRCRRNLSPPFPRAQSGCAILRCYRDGCDLPLPWNHVGGRRRAPPGASGAKTRATRAIKTAKRSACGIMMCRRRDSLARAEARPSLANASAASRLKDNASTHRI